MGQCLRKSTNDKAHVHQAGDELYPDGAEKDLQNFTRFGRALYGRTWGLHNARLRFREEDEEVKSKNSKEVINLEKDVY